MQGPLSEKIARLEEKIISLRKKLRDSSLSIYQANELETELWNAEEALRLYRNAASNSNKGS